MFDDDDFGAQGGDPRRMAGLQIDLSTCVNFYGPPPAVLDLLRDGVDPRDLQIHPYGAVERMEAAYARHLGVPASQLVAGRGTTEFIWALSRELPHAAVAVPLPGYTDYLKAFPGRGFAGPAGPDRRAHRGGARVGIARDPLQPAQPQRRCARSGRAHRRRPAPSRRDPRRRRVLRRLRARSCGCERRRYGRGEHRRAALAVEVLGHRCDARRRRLVRRSPAAVRPARPARDVADLRPRRCRGGGRDGERRVGRALSPGPRPRRRLAGRRAARAAGRARRAARRGALSLPHHRARRRARRADGVPRCRCARARLGTRRRPRRAARARAAAPSARACRAGDAPRLALAA